MNLFYLTVSRLTSTTAILLSLVWLFFLTDASPQLRSDIDIKIDTTNSRELNGPTNFPCNDLCDHAMIIPAIAPGSNYTTPGVTIEKATAERNLSCYLTPPGTTKDVWYEFTPSTTSFYTFGTNLQHIQLDILLKRNSSCELSMALNCQETRPSFDRALMQDITYLIFVQPKLAHNVTGRLQLTVRNRKLPPNGQCRNATTIDPTLETFLPIRASNFAIESPSILLDTVCGIIPKFWYKITNPLTTPISVDITLHSSMYTRRSYISVVRASNCSTLQCVGGVVEIGSSSYNFVTEQLSSYYIIVNNGSRKPFNITIKGRTSFFSLIENISAIFEHFISRNIPLFSGFDTDSEYVFNILCFENLLPNSLKKQHNPYLPLNDRQSFETTRQGRRGLPRITSTASRNVIFRWVHKPDYRVKRELTTKNRNGFQ